MRTVLTHIVAFCLLGIFSCTGDERASRFLPSFNGDSFTSVNSDDLKNLLEDVYRESSRENADSPSMKDGPDTFAPVPDAEDQLVNDLLLYDILANDDEADSDWDDSANTNYFGTSQDRQRLLDFALLEDMLDNYEEETNSDQWVGILPNQDAEEESTFDIPVLDQDSVTLDGKKEREQDDAAQEKENENKDGKSDSEAMKRDQSDEDQLRSLLAELEDSVEAKRSHDSEDYSKSNDASGVKMSEMAKVDNDIKIEVKLPGVSVNQDDTYLCTGVRISDYTQNYNDSIYITRYIPHAKETVAHHMLLYGCMSPGMTKPGAVWNCGGTMAGTKESNYPLASLCGDGARSILWAWAKNAPAFTLPKDIGFKVGVGTNVRYLVLQVHYKSAKVFKGGKKDHSAVTVIATKKKMPRLAGVYVLGSAMETVMPHQTKNFDIYCKYRQTFSIHPFAFRTHTHALGVEVIGFRIRDAVWTLIGAKNPQLPEAFYPVATKNMTIRYNDWLAARCVMRNFRDVPTSIGWKHTDEMCNFYIMFWTESKNEKEMDSWQKSCNNGFPWVHWSSLPGFYS